MTYNNSRIPLCHEPNTILKQQIGIDSIQREDAMMEFADIYSANLSTAVYVYGALAILTGLAFTALLLTRDRVPSATAVTNVESATLT
jgi:hypothetical protein